MMNWDQFGTSDSGQAATGEKRQVADGTHTPTIGWVRIRQHDWAKSEKNQDGSVLTVRLDFGRDIQSIFDGIRCDHTGAIAALCRSARVDPPRGDWDETVLVGQVVLVDIALAVSNRGKEFHRVTYRPQAEPLPAELRERPARTPTQKADAASTTTDPDDIPF